MGNVPGDQVRVFDWVKWPNIFVLCANGLAVSVCALPVEVMARFDVFDDDVPVHRVPPVVRKLAPTMVIEVADSAILHRQRYDCGGGHGALWSALAQGQKVVSGKQWRI